MKATIRRALETVGLTPVGQLERSTAETRQLSDKLQLLENRMGKLRADAEAWKQRHDEASAKLRECRDMAAKVAADAERMREGAEHAKMRAAEWKARAEALTVEKRDLRARLEEAHRSALTAREYVMATESKLDLIEAAIQLLDSRTREAAVTARG
jgi:chromosome segregation ATPase